MPYNQALYGRGYCGTPLGAAVTTCASTKALVRDAMAVWVDNQLKSGQTMAEIQDYLKTFDVQDRYDVDGDGNYDEPDGFIDHFQIVHAGGDEAASDPIYGSDAIWSHRWYANLQVRRPRRLTGVNIGSNGGAFGLGANTANPVPNNPTGVWVGDYTIQPENGGLGVFAHEYAHDLGLPDLYDTSGNTGGAREQHRLLDADVVRRQHRRRRRHGIGDAPADMGAWELLQLGWLDAQGDQGPFYDLVQRRPAQGTVRLGNNVPASTGGAQALIVGAPRRRACRVARRRRSPVQQMFWSTEGNDLETTMTEDGCLRHQRSPPRSTTSSSPTGTTPTSRPRPTTARRGPTVPTNLSTSGTRAAPTPRTRATASPAPPTRLGRPDRDRCRPAPTRCGSATHGPTSPRWLAACCVDDVAIDGTLIGTAETDDRGLGVRRVHAAPTGTEVETVLQRLHRREPSVRRLRQPR